MFTDDYIMRQIEMLSRSIAKVVFDKDTNTVDLIRQDDVGGSLSRKRGRHAFQNSGFGYQRRGK